MIEKDMILGTGKVARIFNDDGEIVVRIESENGVIYSMIRFTGLAEDLRDTVIENAIKAVLD